MRRFAIVSTILTLTLVACYSAAQSKADASGQLWRDPGQAAPAVQVPNQGSLAPLIKTLKPAVVNISVTTVTKNPHRSLKRNGASPHGMPGMPGAPGGEGDWEQFFERYFGQPQQQPEDFKSNSLGSGFIINQDGYVLTNNHVVKDATDIRVKLSDNHEYAGKVIGKDPQTDVALIKLEDAPKNLPTVVLGDSDKLEQGDFVLALGNPLGLRESATFGMVSAKDRAINPGASGTYDDFIQTDAAINPGNSGGPLFNLKGEVVGINTAIVSPQIGQGIGFAVPVNLAKQILPQLLAKGKVTRGYLGVSVSELSPDLAEGFGLDPDTRGAVVQQVVPNAPAAKAGIKPGDIVVTLNGRPVESSGQLTRGVAMIPPGGKAHVTVLRSGAKKDLTVTVSTRPESDEALARGEFGGEGEGEEAATASKSQAKLGLKVTSLTPEIAKQLGASGDTGVVVSEVVSDGPADRAGIQRGDLILELKGQVISAPDQLAKILAGLKPGQTVALRVRRGQNAFFIPVRLGGAEAKK
ncbi:MAG TPA: DegQ family serine endoprotease [Anaeromyxobacteraceae bacterium]|jgi:serine protease Do|nr:DegQ family serine endoprotease [Anaeromyxobacteraceae bacterium]